MKPNFKTILIPIDFSKLSAGAIETGKDLAARFGASSIHLVHVHEFYYPAGFMSPVPLAMKTYREEDAARRVRRLEMLSRRAGLSPAHCHCLTGAPVFKEVCQLAQEIRADLIVMPTHSYKGLEHLFAGSTAERIVQHAPCPVLVARPAGRKSPLLAIAKRYDTILVPVDFSQASFQALEYAIGFAERVAARLILFHAVDCGDALTADGYAMYDLSAIEDKLRKNAQEQMQKHFLIGSVAESVVRYAKYPVLVVPSHPEARAACLTKTTSARDRLPSASRNGESVSQLRTSRTKRNRKLLAHPAPERRKTNRYRESHAALARSRS
jgi:nucleotide-binding universal stress UspA family protein